MGTILGFIVKLVVIGGGIFIANKALSKKTKELHFQVGNLIKIDSTFYKE